MMKSILFVLLLSLVELNAIEAFGIRPKRQATYDISDKPEYQDSNGRDYMLAASSDVILKKKRMNQLVCSEPGFFADVSNECQVYHVCVETGRPDQSGYDLRQYSFFCGAGTIFDQYKLTCEVPEKAVPCQFAPYFYEINKRTEQGRKEVFIHDEDDKPLVLPYYEQASQEAKQLKSKGEAPTEATDDDDLMAD